MLEKCSLAHSIAERLVNPTGIPFMETSIIVVIQDDFLLEYNIDHPCRGNSAALRNISEYSLREENVETRIAVRIRATHQPLVQKTMVAVK